jgi:hypothetical protein
MGGDAPGWGSFGVLGRVAHVGEDEGVIGGHLLGARKFEPVGDVALGVGGEDVALVATLDLADKGKRDGSDDVGDVGEGDRVVVVGVGVGGGEGLEFLAVVEVADEGGVRHGILQ